MKNIVIVTLAFASAVLIANAATLEDVLDLHKTAIGGPAVDKVQSLFIASTLEGMGMTGADFTAVMKPDKFLNETHIGPITHVIGTDGAVAWQIDFNGKVSELLGKDADMVTISAYFANYRYLAPEPATAALVEETETHYVIEYTAFPKNPVRAYVNKATGLLDLTELESELGSVITTFKDYAEANGVMLPRQIEQTIGTDTLVSITGSVAINEGVTAEMFAMPAGDFKDYVFEGDAASTTVPLEFVGALPCVAVTIMGSGPFNFLLDTGASITVLDSKTAADLGFEPEGELGGIGAAGTDTAALAVLPSLSVGGVTVVNAAVAVLDISTISEYAGKELAGVLGADFCRRFVIELDYENGRATILDPDAFDPPIDAEFIPLTYLSGIPLVNASVGVYEGEFVVDTGNAGSLIFHKPYADEHKLLEAFDEYITSTSLGIGGPFTDYVVRAEDVKLGHYEIDDPVVEIATVDEGALAMKNIAGNIGAGLLSRFTLYLDYPGNRLGLIPNSRFDEPFPYNRSGFTVSATETGYAVNGVIEKSPAAKAGLKPGDLVVAVDNTTAEDLSVRRLSEIVSQPAGTEVQIEFNRAGSSYTKKIVLEELL